jgi:serine/threonine-protein kinase HipA
LEDPNASEKPRYRAWLEALLAPGSSLGGGRPKAAFSDIDKTLWIAKFPSRNDRRDIGAWETVAHALALMAGIKVPAARLLEIDLADYIQRVGSPDDLLELWKRLVLNILVGNKDDHLRNHGFILEKSGWRLSPAYDVNPNIEKTEHALSIDSQNAAGDLELALSTVRFYRLKLKDAQRIVNEVRSVVAGWRKEAKRLHIAASEIDLMAPAFTGS